MPSGEGRAGSHRAEQMSPAGGAGVLQEPQCESFPSGVWQGQARCLASARHVAGSVGDAGVVEHFHSLTHLPVPQAFVEHLLGARDTGK